MASTTRTHFHGLVSVLVVIISALIAAAPASAVQDGVFWSGDGKTVQIATNSSNGGDAAATVVVIDLATGRTLDSAQLSTHSCLTGDDSQMAARESKECFRKKDLGEKKLDADAAKWVAAHAAVKAAWEGGGPGGVNLTKVGANRVVHVLVPGRPPHEAPLPTGVAIEEPLQPERVAWSPDRQWVALDASHEAMGAYVLVAGKGRIDLLDAGAGAAVGDVAKTLTKEGFEVAHQAKAGAPHAVTEVFFAPGFEADAKIVARLVKAPAAPKQVAWSTAFAITVAAAKQP
jgi:hypothetical protein